MGLNNEGEVFLTQDDQEAHILKQFQTQSGELFDFKEGCDTTIYEVHKQCNLRSRKIDVSEVNKQKASKQPIKGKAATSPVQILSRSNNNPPNPITVDVSDNQPNNGDSSTPLTTKGTIEKPPENNLGENANLNPTPKKEKNIENRENPTVRNIKSQTEKPFNLETEAGKLKIVVPLSESAKHDTY